MTVPSLWCAYTSIIEHWIYGRRQLFVDKALWVNKMRKGINFKQTSPSIKRLYVHTNFHRDLCLTNSNLSLFFIFSNCSLRYAFCSFSLRKKKSQFNNLLLNFFFLLASSHSTEHKIKSNSNNNHWCVKCFISPGSTFYNLKNLSLSSNFSCRIHQFGMTWGVRRIYLNMF